MDPGRGFPEHVLDQLGLQARDVTGGGRSIVLRGNDLVAKAGPPDVITRERLVVEHLAHRLPLRVPGLRDAGEDWVLLDLVADTDQPWTAAEVEAALADLAALHAAFRDDAVLGAPVLRDPLGADLDVKLRFARRMPGLDAILPGAAALADDPSPLLEALTTQPDTLLHGDPWPENIRRPSPTERVWVDWAGVARGPAALDVATWLDQAAWVLDEPSDPGPGQQLDWYLEAAEVADPEAFRRAVDAATLLWFLTIDVSRLPVVRHAPHVVERLLEPRRAALRRLGMTA